MRSHTDNISSSSPLHWFAKTILPFRRRIVHFYGELSTLFLWFPMYLIFLTFTFLKLIYHHSDEGSSLSIFIIAIVIFLWFLTDFVLAVWPDVTFFLQEKPEEEQKYWVNVHCSFSDGFQITEEELNVAWELGSNHKSESCFASSLLIKLWWWWLLHYQLLIELWWWCLWPWELLLFFIAF